MVTLNAILEKLGKRQVYLGLSVFLAVSLFLTPSWSTPVKWGVVLALGLAVVMVSFRLFGDLSKTLLPALLFLGGFLVLLYFPSFSTLFRILFLLFWVVSFNACLLAENVFSVSQIRGVAIPLVRPAQTVSLLLTLLTAFLLMTGIYKSALPFYWQALLVGLAIFFLAWHNMTGQLLDFAPDFLEGSVLRKRAITAAFWISWGLFQLALALSFLPQKSFFRSLSLTTALYFGLGIYLHLSHHSLNRKVMGEYLGVAVLVTLLILLVD